jgi:hypothetical protein
LERVLDGDQLLGLQGVGILAFHVPTPLPATTTASHKH